MSAPPPVDPAHAEDPSVDIRSLRIAVSHPDPKIVVLAVTGELDLATAPELDRRLAEALVVGQHGLVVVDLTGVVFLGVAGITVLLGHRARADREIAAFRLVADSRVVLRPLRLLELDHDFDIHPTVMAALNPG